MNVLYVRWHSVEVSYSVESAKSERLIADCLVVQLFNMIQKAQTASENAEAAKVALRGSGKPTLPAPDFNSKSRAKGKKQDNAIGRVKEGLYTTCYGCCAWY